MWNTLWLVKEMIWKIRGGCVLSLPVIKFQKPQRKIHDLHNRATQKATVFVFVCINQDFPPVLANVKYIGLQVHSHIGGTMKHSL